MEERTSVVEVGEKIINEDGKPIVVKSIEVGRYGLLVKGALVLSGLDTFVLYPYELAAVDNLITRWHGWGVRGNHTLPCGADIGFVAFFRYDPRPRMMDEYDKEWERTPTEGVMQSRPTPIRLN